ncbi:MAG: hypothetical protein IOC64_06530 [Methylobacterium sp.]|nr:hypothetical protein [Methylobacterium sp.]MCA3600179.1 hypothetical protein [Methylobacterium sp.]MCA3605946.1 hypothetical protein [Methylobacterium sp.]MCA4923980.1 hypothetical protein [Methylobacterium sp.]
MNAHLAMMGAQTRLATINTADVTARTIEVTWTTGAPVRRRVWRDGQGYLPFDEELEVSQRAIDFTRLSAGAAVVDSHDTYSTRNQVAVVERAWIVGEEGRATIRFPSPGIDPAADRMWGMANEGIIRNISVGYRVIEAEYIDPVRVGEAGKMRVTRWMPFELSFVVVGADAGAQTRSAPDSDLEPIVFNRAAAPITQESEMPDNENRAAAEEPVNAQNTETRAAPAPQADLRAERSRVAEITRLAQEHGVDSARSVEAIEQGETLDAFRAFVLNQITQRQRPSSHVRVEQDETETRRLGMQEAIIRGMGFGEGQVSEHARPYMDLSLVALAAERMGVRRVPETFGERQQLLERSMHTTSDFPIILESALNVSIGQRYLRLTPTYREWARRDDFVDFRPHTTVNIGDFPMLQRIGEAGEIRFGTVGEKKETVAVASYGRGLAFSRQLLVNDRLGALGRVLADYGQTIALLEENLAYAQLTLNSGAGPNLLEPLVAGNPATGAMFHAQRNNLATAATPINEAGLSAGRAAMRKYTSVDGNTLLYTPASFILCSPDKETEAQKLVTAILANQTQSVNVFSGLRVVVGNQLSGNRWWLFTDPSARSNFRYGLLEGFTAPRVRMEEPFGSQGMRVTVEHDFGIGGDDWRAAFCNPGA